MKGKFIYTAQFHVQGNSETKLNGYREEKETEWWKSAKKNPKTV